jgi:hypothetical protein
LQNEHHARERKRDFSEFYNEIIDAMLKKYREMKALVLAFCLKIQKYLSTMSEEFSSTFLSNVLWII